VGGIFYIIRVGCGQYLGEWFEIWNMWVGVLGVALGWGEIWVENGVGQVLVRLDYDLGMGWKQSIFGKVVFVENVFCYVWVVCSAIFKIEHRIGQHQKEPPRNSAHYSILKCV
jgi:hypothetical protein